MHKLILLTLSLILFPSTYAQVNIWENTSCRKNVEMKLFLANGAKNPAVIICPGGSYFWHDTHNEATLVAKWLQRKGISAFVLKYRTAHVPAFVTHYRYIFRGNRYPDAQNDLKQALNYVRANAGNYGIDINKIGLMGFSAGGHLVMSSVELFDECDWPAFIACIYPVVTMTQECAHKRSRRGLLGDSKVKNEFLKDKLSLEKHVPRNCPPVFLLNCKDDPIVDYRNSELLDSALTIKEVPHLYIQYQTGGHGFGASDTKGSSECRQWKDAFLNWFKQLFPLNNI